MKAVILAGGQGSRLRPLTETVPKPMVSVLGRPIMEHIVRHLAGFGIEEMVSTLHYRPRVIRDHFGDGADFGVRMRYTLETHPLGTAGSVKLGQRYLDETFLVVGGDAMMDFDMQAFLDYHRAKGAKVSLCLTRVRDPGEFGIVITDDDGRVQRFLEKPGPSEVFSDTVNTGIYLIEPDVLEKVPVGKAYDFAGDLFPALLEAGAPMYGYVADGYWSDIGTLEQLRQTHWDMLDNMVHLPIDGNLMEDGVWVGQGVVVHPEAELNSPCWLGDNVRVARSARVGPYTVLADNVELDRQATVHRSLVMSNSFIGQGADVRNTIVGRRNIVGARCELGDEVVLGAGSRLGRGVVVKPGVLIWPEKEVEAGSTVMENVVWESLLRPSVFGSRGVAGLANLHLTPEFAAAMGKAFGTWVKMGSKVAVSRDGHPFSRLVKRALVSGLLSVGVDVDDLRDGSAPVTRFLTAFGEDLKGGLHVRIADVDPRVGLIEMYTGAGLPLSRSVRRKVEATFHRADFPRVSLDQVGSLVYPGGEHQHYLRHLSAGISLDKFRQQAEKVIFHSADERTGAMLADVLGRNGVPYLQAGGFRRHDDAGLTQQVAAVARLNHSLALILDRNAEALVLVDEAGVVYPTDRVEQLLTAAFIRSAPAGEPVYLPPDHAALLRTMAEAEGRTVVLTRKEPAARLKEATSGSSSAEQWRWLEFDHYYLGFDAIAGALRLLEFLGNVEMHLMDFEREIPVCYRDSLTVPCRWEDMGRAMRELSQKPEVARHDVPEGVRLQFEGGRVYVCPSADAPEIQVTVETEEAGELPSLLDRITRDCARLVS